MPIWTNTTYLCTNSLPAFRTRSTELDFFGLNQFCNLHAYSLAITSATKLLLSTVSMPSFDFWFVVVYMILYTAKTML